MTKSPMSSRVNPGFSDLSNHLPSKAANEGCVNPWSRSEPIIARILSVIGLYTRPIVIGNTP